MAYNNDRAYPIDRGIPGRERPYRAREVRRMATFNEGSAIRQGKLEQSADQYFRGRDLLTMSNPQPSDRRRGAPPMSAMRPEGLPAPSTTETPPRDEPMYDGNCSGSRPLTYTIGHNLDYSGFLPVLEETYAAYEHVNPVFSRSVPFCAYQHAYTEVLNAHILSEAKKRGHPSMAFNPDPLKEAQLLEVNIPVPIKTYIEAASETMTPAGDLVKINLSEAAIPKGPHGDMASGNFGALTARTHNAYETHVSPYITRRLIEQTIAVNTAEPGGNFAAQAQYRNRFDDWDPFPDNMQPTNGVANKNLLGYHRPERIRPETLNFLKSVHFYNDNSVLGRISHSPEIIARVSAFIGKETRIKHAKCDFKPISGSSTLIIKEALPIPPEENRLADMQCTSYSAYSFSSSDSNKANYFGYKRIRTAENPGLCFTFLANPPTWVETRNDNLMMLNDFRGMAGLRDDPGLRRRKHLEQCGSGTVHDALNRWIYRHYVIDERK